jgi:hypothetical protein
MFPICSIQKTEESNDLMAEIGISDFRVILKKSRGEMLRGFAFNALFLKFYDPEFGVIRLFEKFHVR